MTPLPTKTFGAKIFFAKDVQPAVLDACRKTGISFDAFAAKLGMPRASLVLILKGQDPVARHTLQVIEEMIAKAQPAAPPQSVAA